MRLSEHIDNGEVRHWKWWCSAHGTLTYKARCDDGTPHKAVLIVESSKWNAELADADSVWGCD